MKSFVKRNQTSSKNGIKTDTVQTISDDEEMLSSIDVNSPAPKHGGKKAKPLN